MRSLNSNNRLKASDAKESAKANLSTLLNHRIEDSEDSVYAMVSCFVFGFFDPKNRTDEKDYGNDAMTSFCQSFPSNISCRKIRLDQSFVRNYVKFGTVLLESEEASDQCVDNSAISTDNSEDSDIFHDSDHDPFDAESKEDVQHKDKPFE